MSTWKIVLIVVGAIALVMAVIVGFVYWDARTNYSAVEARVTSVEQVCDLRRLSGRNRSTRTTELMSCDVARRLAETSEYRHYNVRERKRIGYSYTSPVDRRSYDGSITVDGDDYPELRPGQPIEIFAHETRPEVSRRPI